MIDYCIQTGRLYESRNKGHSNVVFVGLTKMARRGSAVCAGSVKDVSTVI